MALKDIIPLKRKTGSNYIPLAHIQQQMNEIFGRFLTDWDVLPSLTYSLIFLLSMLLKQKKM